MGGGERKKRGGREGEEIRMGIREGLVKKGKRREGKERGREVRVSNLGERKRLQLRRGVASGEEKEWRR